MTAFSTRSLILTFCIAGSILLARRSDAQSAPAERAFPQSKVAVEKTLKQLQSSASGRLPVLDGFTRPSDLPLDRFQRGYYQCAIQVSSTASGGSLVRVTAKITAWYTDPASTKSGYQVLPSNGRLESDFLDRLQDALSAQATSPPAIQSAAPAASKPKNNPAAPEPTLSAPMPSTGASRNSPFKMGSPTNSDAVTSIATRKAVEDKQIQELTKEAKGLEEILRNQAHPKNLVAVKKSNTPVLISPAEGAKVLFLATAEDEFEILDMNASWVHVRISGLSRGWIRRSSLEIPEDFESDAKVDARVDEKVEKTPVPTNGEHFQIKNEEIASFPGDWEALHGKTVKILTVQTASGSASETGSRAKLEFTKSLFEKEYAELTKTATTAAGVVVIFDSSDGGMAATTLPTIQQWKAGALSEQAFWRRCYLDPPETFMPQSSQ